MAFRESFGRDSSAKRIAAALLALAACLGCGGKSASTGADRQLRAAMQLLGREYGGYVAEHKGAAPPDEAAIRAYLQSRMSELSTYGVGSVDDLLRVGRDGQPLKIIYGTKIALRERPEYALAAHEQTANDGKRLACDSRGGVYELDDKSFTEQFGAR